MNGRQPQVERVPLTEAEVEHLAPIMDRWEAAQRDFQMAQRDAIAAAKLYRAQHKAELGDGAEWQLDRDAFVRQLPPAVAIPQNGNDLEMEKQLATLMDG